MSTNTLQPKHNGELDPMKEPDPATAARRAEELIRQGMAATDDHFSGMVALAIHYAAHAIKAQEDRYSDAASIDHLLRFFSDSNYPFWVLKITRDENTHAWCVTAPLDDEVRRFFEHAYYGVWDGHTRHQVAISATNALIEATSNNRPSQHKAGTTLPAEQRTSGYCLPYDKDPMNDDTVAAAAESTARFVMDASGIREDYFLGLLTPMIRNAAAAVKSYEDCYRAERATTEDLELFFANPDYRSQVLNTITGRGKSAPRRPAKQLTPHSPRLDEETTRFFDERFYNYFAPDQQLAYLWYCKSAVANALHETEAEGSSRGPRRETIGED